MENLALKRKLQLVDGNGDIIDTPFETPLTLTDLYDLCDSQTVDKLVRDYLNEYGLVPIPSPAFVVSYVESRPIFDGSVEEQEFFVVRHYRNNTLIREECFPTQELSTPETIESTKESD